MTVARSTTASAFALLAGTSFVAAPDDIDPAHLLTGPAALVDYKGVKAGQFRKITVGDLPKPYATESARNNAHIVPRPADVWPQAPAGFTVDLFTADVQGPRQIRLAPNGDVFVAETRA